MTESQIIERVPGIVNVTIDVLNKISNKIIGTNLDFNKTWIDNGFDDLDCVEMIMELEKELDIVIPDDIADFIISTNIKPIIFKSWNRNKRLEDLGL